MQGRATSDRGALAPRPRVMAQRKDRRSFGRDASLVGEHSVSGEGVPAGLKFALSDERFHAGDCAHAVGHAADTLQLSWQAVGPARRFHHAIGGDGDTVFWIQPRPEVGMGLMDFASPATSSNG